MPAQRRGTERARLCDVWPAAGFGGGCRHAVTTVPAELHAPEGAPAPPTGVRCDAAERLRHPKVVATSRRTSTRRGETAPAVGATGGIKTARRAAPASVRGNRRARLRAARWARAAVTMTRSWIYCHGSLRVGSVSRTLAAVTVLPRRREHEPSTEHLGSPPQRIPLPGSFLDPLHVAGLWAALPLAIGQNERSPVDSLSARRTCQGGSADPDTLDELKPLALEQLARSAVQAAPP
jgi:hypothetical protein